MKTFFLFVLPALILLSCASPAPAQPRAQTSSPAAIPPAPRPFSTPPGARPDTPAPALVTTPIPRLEPAAPLPPIVEPLSSPAAQLSSDRIEAESVERLILYYQLKIDNPRAVPLYVELTEPHILLNGTYSVTVSSLLLQNGDTIVAQPAASTTLPLQLNLDLSTLPIDADEYTFELAFTVIYHAETGETLSEELSCNVSFQRVRVPELLVTGIEVSQDELINTRLKVTLRVDNPNLFAVQLSSLTYQLYGEERLWAEGDSPLSQNIPAKGSASTDLSLIMNFTNMPRSVLDSVIAMKQLNYRFTGETIVTVPVAYLPSFKLAFDLKGKSSVVQ
jgi:LEA14-like dessication related protein